MRTGYSHATDIYMFSYNIPARLVVLKARSRVEIPIFLDLVRQYVDVKVRAPAGNHWQTDLGQRGKGSGHGRIGYISGSL